MNLEIAPNVFVNDWEDVTVGYLHGSGDYLQFIIRMNDGHTIAVRDKAEIQQTLDHWRSTAASPLEPKSSKVPADIVQWMGKRRAGRWA